MYCTMNGGSCEWSSEDFASRYISRSSRNSSPERERNYESNISFTSSPDHHTYDLLCAEKKFCNRDNIDQSISYLNQELSVLGFPSLFALGNSEGGPADTFDIVRLVNCTYELLILQQQNARLRSDLESRHQRAECDNEHLIQAQKRLKEQLEVAQREIAMQNERERQLQLKNKKLKDDLKSEKEEVKKIKASCQHLQKQFHHEGKKREKEMTKLKERLHQLLTDKTHERRVGMDILNSLQRADGRRGLWKTGSKGEEDMYRILITNYEQRQKELMEENSDLRESLRGMQTELVNLLNRQDSVFTQDKEGSEPSEDGSLSVHSLPAGHFDMPYEMVREGIEKSLREKWRILRAKLDTAKKAATVGNPQMNREIQTAPDLVDELDRLEKQLANYRHVVEQQETIIQSLQSKDETEGHVENSFLSDSMLYEEWEKLQKEKELLKDQQSAFDGERQKFTEAAIRLGRDRKKFEEEKSSLFKQLTAPQLNKKKSSTSTSPERTSPLASKLQFSTPVFSPAPQRKVDSVNTASSLPSIPRDGPIATPSTEELYRALKLPVKHKEQSFNETPRSKSERAESQLSGSCLSDNQSAKENKNNDVVEREKQKRINEHAQNVKRVLQLKQRSTSYD